VPYRGAGPAFNDLIPGRVDAMFNFVLSSLPLVRQDQLRALAVLTSKRLSVAPDLPTMGEAGGAIAPPAKLRSIVLAGAERGWCRIGTAATVLTVLLNC
jgi:tripartite-type tricarboxylate transporter receptor subunit TctC